MSTMTPIQHHALVLARAGYWGLADAMELLHLHAEDPRVFAVCHPVGDQLAVGYDEAGDRDAAPMCVNCDGTGEIECNMGHLHDCDLCDGTGRAVVAQYTALLARLMQGSSEAAR